MTQAASVVLVHRSDLTGPFLVGSESARIAPWPIHVQPAPTTDGYDGQFYLALSFDPFLKTPLQLALDDPEYRARRITWPLLAWALALGKVALHPALLHLLWLAFLGVGAAGLSNWTVGRGVNPWWTLAFATQSGVLVCAWRMLGDAIMVSLLLLALTLAERSGRGRSLSFATLSAALLQKETALLGLPALAEAWQQRRPRVPWLEMAGSCIAVAAWWIFVGISTSSIGPFSPSITFSLPGMGWVEALRHAAGASKSGLALAKDFVFLSIHGGMVATGCVIGTVGLVEWRRTRKLPGLPITVGLYSLMGLALSANVWGEVWAYTRVLLPLGVLELMWALEAGSREPRVATDNRGASALRKTVLALVTGNSAAGIVFIVKNGILGTP